MVLALLLFLQPSLPSLEPLYREAVALREKQLGPKHPKLADSLVDLAAFLRRRGETAEPEQLLNRALAIVDTHDDALRALAEIHEERGDLKTAALLLTRAREDAAVLVRLADITERLGDPQAAEQFYRRALKHAPTGPVLNGLGLNLETQGRIAEAEQMFARAAAAYEKSHGRDHPEFATALLNLAGTVRARHDLGTAVRMLTHALSVLDRTVGPEHPHTQAACSQLAQTLKMQNKPPVQCRGRSFEPRSKTPIQ